MCNVPVLIIRWSGKSSGQEEKTCFRFKINITAFIFNLFLMFLTGHLHLEAVFFSYIKGNNRR